jgi:hypothetical protein
MHNSKLEIKAPLQYYLTIKNSKILKTKRVNQIKVLVCWKLNKAIRESHLSSIKVMQI